MELKGSLRNFSLPDIVQLIGTTRRTGVLVVSVGPEKSSVYFEEGNIVHAASRDLAGQEAINWIFRQKEGGFQFLSDVEAPEKTVAMDWMNALMEAARLDDESRKGSGEDPDLPGGEGGRSWDPERVKAGMEEVLVKAFGRKVRKITTELKKNPGSKLSLLEFCEKAEKYIYVFVDNKRAEEVSRQLRAVIEEAIL